MAEPFDVFSDGFSPSSVACMFGTGSIYGTEYIDSYFIFIYFYKFNQSLLTKLCVCLYFEKT